MLRPVLAAIVASAALLGAAAAHAGTHWSVGINVPVAGVVVSDGGGYYAREPAPVYHVPAPEVRYAPVPRYFVPEQYYEDRDAYAPPVVRVAPEVVYEVPDRGWRRESDASWERHQQLEDAHWEHERHEHWERQRGRDDGNSHRWHHD